MTVLLATRGVVELEEELRLLGIDLTVGIQSFTELSHRMSFLIS